MSRTWLDRVGLVWLGLIAATLCTWQLGADHQLTPGLARVTAGTVVAIAFVKVRFVGMHFMDLRSAPTALRLAFDTWTVVIGGTAIALVVS